jgi:hypothetical protein
MTRLQFFFDRNFQKPIARLIGQFEPTHRIVVMDDDERFSPTMSDVDWLKILGSEDLATSVITQDKKILTRTLERAAFRAAGVKFFYLTGKSWSRWSLHEQAWRFLRVWPEIVKTAQTHRGKVFEITGPQLKISSAG